MDNDEREPVKRKAGKKNSLSEEMSSEDVWQGFGEETSREDRERKENEEMANDVRVVLLQNKNVSYIRQSSQLGILNKFSLNETVVIFSNGYCETTVLEHRIVKLNT